MDIPNYMRIFHNTSMNTWTADVLFRFHSSTWRLKKKLISSWSHVETTQEELFILLLGERVKAILFRHYFLRGNSDTDIKFCCYWETRKPPNVFWLLGYGGKLRLTSIYNVDLLHHQEKKFSFKLHRYSTNMYSTCVYWRHCFTWCYQLRHGNRDFAKINTETLSVGNIALKLDAEVLSDLHVSSELNLIAYRKDSWWTQLKIHSNKSKLHS